MKTLLIALAIVAAALVILWLIGWWLPRSHRAGSRLLLAHPPAMVWAVIRNQQEVASWWPEVKITEEGWVANSFFRVFARLMGHLRTIDGYLGSLARRFAESAEPTHLP